ncbi:MAG TPA: UPF0280 family protein [Bacteroidales bacterium]|nr:UPF0280 family protein [Bacteroidales bacterium]
MGNERWTSFHHQHHESDIWIAVNSESYSDELKRYTFGRIKYYRQILDDHIGKNPEFLSSLVPLVPEEDVHPLIADMYKAASVAGVGPMAAVAGAFAEHLCRDTSSEFNVKEMIAENGGDIFLMLEKPSTISVFAGDSPLSDRIGIIAVPEQSPLSICCSSGTVGHSLSFGTADACVIACRSGALADAYATAACNQVKNKEMVQEITTNFLEKPGILSVVIIKEDRVAIGGILELTVL